MGNYDIRFITYSPEEAERCKSILLEYTDDVQIDNQCPWIPRVMGVFKDKKFDRRDIEILRERICYQLAK